MDDQHKASQKSVSLKLDAEQLPLQQLGIQLEQQCEQLQSGAPWAPPPASVQADQTEQKQRKQPVQKLLGDTIVFPEPWGAEPERMSGSSLKTKAEKSNGIALAEIETSLCEERGTAQDTMRRQYSAACLRAREQANKEGSNEGNSAHSERSEYSSKDGARRSTDSEASPPQKEISASYCEDTDPVEEAEDEDDDSSAHVDKDLEFCKAAAVAGFVAVSWVVIFGVFSMSSASFVEPVCSDEPNHQVSACEVCSRQTLIAPLFGDYEHSLEPALRVALYFVGVIWFLMGTNCVCDQFVAAIEEIASRSRDIWLHDIHGSDRRIPVKVWNPTIANLTLMALGSSAPEILLNVIELFGAGFFVGELGPATILGSAAFNLMVITGVCISALPPEKAKKIQSTDVFGFTASMSIFAYAWLVVILQLNTPDKVDSWEAITTLLFFPFLVMVAYAVDKLSTRRKLLCMSEQSKELMVYRAKATYGHELTKVSVRVLLDLLMEYMVSALKKSSHSSMEKKASSIQRGSVRASDLSTVDDEPRFHFTAEELFPAPPAYCSRSSVKTCTAKLYVNRTGTFQGPASVRYKTRNGNAMDGIHFIGVEGKLHFAEGQTYKAIRVEVTAYSGAASTTASSERFFEVALFSPSAGYSIVQRMDQDDGMYGLHGNAVARVVLASIVEPSLQQRGKLLRRGLEAAFEELRLEWQEQFSTAFYCNGSPKEQAESSWMDWVFHCVSLSFRVVFALIPPPSILGGWPCFWCALGMVGLVTAVVGDLALLLGCILGLPADVTAITLVAMGTSLPDTFASQAAAQHNDTADDAIGNVTGSNCANVFLGLGLPWTFGALYWQQTGRTEAWDFRMHQGQTYKELFPQYPEGGFMVPAGALGFSVGVFTCCAVLCLLLLFVRRMVYGGELGGPRSAALRDTCLLLALWVAFVVVAICRSLEVF
eukprot:TRINITY_DN17373_c0_g1_i1.p1 TRINITY_DN17373_c0_g1~~TRINITY_DN17373_c0_g1_i1.p1  ORF type:complete len:939 (+),score=241.48 TRINITY_DN17373_c0_g1_i1:62-2878(+)